MSDLLLRDLEESISEPALAWVPVSALVPHHREIYWIECDGRFLDDEGNSRGERLRQPPRRREHQVRLGDDQG